MTITKRLYTALYYTYESGDALYAKLIYANNRLTAKLILKDIAASTKRLCTAFVYNSQGSNGVLSKLFKHYKLLTKGRLAVRYAKTIRIQSNYVKCFKGQSACSKFVHYSENLL